MDLNEFAERQEERDMNAMTIMDMIDGLVDIWRDEVCTARR